MPLGRELSIGQLSQRTGLAVSAIRYYEAEGLIASERNAGGHRRFPRSVIRRLSFIRIAQQVGFPLERIRRELSALIERHSPKANYQTTPKLSIQMASKAKQV